MATPTQPRQLPSGRHGLSREAVVRDQRERLLEAMIRTVAKKGYDATTVADVIRAAGVSRTTFYELFEDKEDAFLAAYDAVMDVVVHRTARGYQADLGRPWPERVHIGLAALVDLLADEAELARVIMVEVTLAGSAARQRYRDSLIRFMPFLDEGRAYSELGGQLPPATSRLAIGGAAALIFDEVRSGRGAELRQILPDLVFAVLMPFIGPEAAAAEMQRKLD